MKVAVVGNIAGVAQEIVVGLRLRGVEADLFTSQAEFDIAMEDLRGQTDLLGAEIIVMDPGGAASTLLSRLRQAARKSIVALRLLRYDVLHVHTAKLCWTFLSYMIFVRAGLRPYLAFATGSDLRETARYDGGRNGRMVRRFFHNAAEVLLLNCDMISFKDEIGLRDAKFFPFVINEEKFVPRDGAGPRDGGDLRLFMMSNLDFGIMDKGEFRRSLKNNERVFHAVAALVAQGDGVWLTVLDRGPDRGIARALVRDLGIEDRVTFLPPTSEEGRIQLMRESDVVLDQFGSGSFGLGALEAMSIGKPLVTYIDETAFSRCYGARELPCLNARYADEIAGALRALIDPDLRRRMSEAGRRFILDCHSRAATLPLLESLYARLGVA